MKKCSACGSFNLDQDNVCGVCGNDLISVILTDEATIDRPFGHVMAADRPRLNKRALLIVFTGPAISALGFVLVLNLLNIGSELLAASGIPILLFGLFATMGTIGTGPSFRLWLRYRSRSRGFPDKSGSYDPRPREVSAEESQHSAEEANEDYETREERKKERFD